MRSRTSELGLRRFWTAKDLRKALKIDRHNRLLQRANIELADDRKYRLLKANDPVAALAFKARTANDTMRPNKIYSVVDMTQSNSQEMAWLLSCHNMCKSIQIEFMMDDFYNNEKEILDSQNEEIDEEDRRRIEKEKRSNRLPGDDIMWLSLCEGIYDSSVFSYIANMGFQVSSRVRSTIQKGGDIPKVDKKGQIILFDHKIDKEADNRDDVTKELALAAELRRVEYTWDPFWRTHFCRRTNRKFYYNLATGERSWKKPLAYQRLRRAKEVKDYKYERPRHTEAHGWDNNVGSWKALTTKAKTDRKRRKRGHKRNAALAKEAREKKLEDIFDRLHHKDDIKAQKRAGAPEDAAGAENENIQVYRGNQVMVVQDADRLRVRISPALIEYDNDDGTYEVIYANGKRESGVARIRIIVSNMQETILLSDEESEDEYFSSSESSSSTDSSDDS